MGSFSFLCYLCCLLFNTTQRIDQEAIEVTESKCDTF